MLENNEYESYSASISSSLKVYCLIKKNSFLKLQKQLAPFIELGVSPLSDGFWKIVPKKLKTQFINQYDVTVIDKNTIPFENSTEFEICFNKKVICINSPEEDSLYDQQVLRNIRMLLRFGIRDQNSSLFLHSAMISLNNKGICFLGDKKSGKTSTVLNLLMNAQASFISNDDLSIEICNDKLQGRGWPRSISVRSDTIPYFKNSNFDLERELHSLAHPTNKNINSATYLYPFELSTIFHSQLINKMNIDCIINLEFHNEECPKIIQLNSFEAEKIIRHNTLTEINLFANAFNSIYSSNEIENVSITKKISNSIPTFTLKHNLNSLIKTANLLKNLCLDI